MVCFVKDHRNPFRQNILVRHFDSGTYLSVDAINGFFFFLVKPNGRYNYNEELTSSTPALF